MLIPPLEERCHGAFFVRCAQADIVSTLPEKLSTISTSHGRVALGPLCSSRRRSDAAMSCLWGPNFIFFLKRAANVMGM